MLTITRKIDQSIVIYDLSGEPIGEVKLTQLDRGQARLSFDFDRDYTILREEVPYDKHKNDQ